MIARRPLRPVLLALACALAAPAAAELPPENRCPSISPASRAGDSFEDATVVRLREGMTLTYADMYSLHALLPKEVWKQRATFFHEGMRLEVGPCHRRYPVPSFFAKATRDYAGQARIDDDGNLRDYTAGRPFPAEHVDPTAPDAGFRWAWNHAYRWQGAGPHGTFRLTDFPSRIGKVQTYRGDFFQAKVAHRSDLADDGYRVDGGEKYSWVSGGRFDEPFDARHLAWRQMRPLKADTRYKEPDTTFVYVPSMRKPRRSATPWVDGLFVPSYRVSSPEGGGGVPFGSNQYGPTGSIQPTAGIQAGTSEHIRRGFVGAAIRPNAYSWRLIGEREVLAPINSSNPGWPENPERNFGESGLSVGGDRWDVRYAVVIEGAARQKRGDVGFVELWIDHQTGQLLYYIARKPNRLILDIGVLVHRFSGDDPRYPGWPNGEKAYVFDPVMASFYAVIEGGTGWRRESYDAVSLPLPEGKMKGITSTSSLIQGR